MTHQVMVSYQQISDAAAAANAAIGVSPAIFPALGVEFVPDATACTNTCPNWVPGRYIDVNGWTSWWNYPETWFSRNIFQSKDVPGILWLFIEHLVWKWEPKLNGGLFAEVKLVL